MKTQVQTITLFLLALTGLSTSAQKVPENQVPAAVMKAFKAKFPPAKKVVWAMENNDYEADFELNKTETSALFDTSGNLLEIESEIAKSSLPQKVRDAVAKDYPDYKMEETAKIEAEGNLSYEVEVKKGDEEMDLIFDENGKLVKTIKKQEKN